MNRPQNIFPKTLTIAKVVCSLRTYQMSIVLSLRNQFQKKSLSCRRFDKKRSKRKGMPYRYVTPADDNDDTHANKREKV